METNRDRLFRGGVKAQCFAVFVPPALKAEQKFQAALDQIHYFYDEVLGKNSEMKHIKVWSDFEGNLAYLDAEEFELLGKPGQYFSYCNDTFLLLGAIIERLTGRLFRRYMTECILDSLHMHRSTFSLEEVAKLPDVSVPYVKNSKENRLEAVPWPQLGNYEVGGLPIIPALLCRTRRRASWRILSVWFCARKGSCGCCSNECRQYACQ